MREPTFQQYAAVQHALVTRSQLLGSGSSRRQIDHQLAVKRLVAVHRNIYRLSGAPVTWEQRMLAACLATGGAASHRAAAYLWGVDLGPVPPVELSVAPEHAPRPSGVVVHRSTDLTCDQIVQRRGIPATNPLRMLVDLGAVVSPGGVELALDSLTSRKVVTIAGVWAYRERLGGKGRRGAGVLGHVLDHRALGDRRADGMLEPAMARLCRDRHLPRPEFQVWVDVDGRWRRMDFAYVAEMIDVEVDGYEDHGGKYENWADDHVRDNELTALGWAVIRFTWHDVRNRPAYVARIINSVLTDHRRLLDLA